MYSNCTAQCYIAAWETAWIIGLGEWAFMSIWDWRNVYSICTNISATSVRPTTGTSASLCVFVTANVQLFGWDITPEWFCAKVTSGNPVGSDSIHRGWRSIGLNKPAGYPVCLKIISLLFGYPTPIHIHKALSLTTIWSQLITQLTDEKVLSVASVISLSRKESFHG